MFYEMFHSVLLTCRVTYLSTVTGASICEGDWHGLHIFHSGKYKWILHCFTITVLPHTYFTLALQVPGGLLARVKESFFYFQNW